MVLSPCRYDSNSSERQSLYPQFHAEEALKGDHIPLFGYCPSVVQSLCHDECLSHRLVSVN